MGVWTELRQDPSIFIEWIGCGKCAVLIFFPTSFGYLWLNSSQRRSRIPLLLVQNCQLSHSFRKCASVASVLTSRGRLLTYHFLHLPSLYQCILCSKKELHPFWQSGVPKRDQNLVHTESPSLSLKLSHIAKLTCFEKLASSKFT